MWYTETDGSQYAYFDRPASLKIWTGLTAIVWLTLAGWGLVSLLKIAGWAWLIDEPVISMCVFGVTGSLGLWHAIRWFKTLTAQGQTRVRLSPEVFEVFDPTQIRRLRRWRLADSPTIFLSPAGSMSLKSRSYSWTVQTHWRLHFHAGIILPLGVKAEDMVAPLMQSLTVARQSCNDCSTPADQ